MIDNSSDGRLLLVDDQVIRADSLLMSLAESHWQIDVLAEVPDIEKVLGPH